MHRRWMWLGVPVVALLELGAHLFCSRRAPGVEDWNVIMEPVRALKRPGDVLFVAPEWAEPLARHALGDGSWPLSELARMDDGGAARAIEVSMLGASDSRLVGWRVTHEEAHGPFRLRVHVNPQYARSLFSVVEATGRGEPEVFRRFEGTRSDCRWNVRAKPSTGGLHGDVAFPRQRYLCGKREVEFVGVTVIDDQDYRPRQCVWAHPPEAGDLWLRFGEVPLGSELVGYAGFSYFQARASDAPVLLEAFIDGAKLGEHSARGRAGWSRFVFPVRGRGAHGRLEFRITSSTFRDVPFCFAAETR
jgi:hypothetical protein